MDATISLQQCYHGQTSQIQTALIFSTNAGAPVSLLTSLQQGLPVYQKRDRPPPKTFAPVHVSEPSTKDTPSSSGTECKPTLLSSYTTPSLDIGRRIAPPTPFPVSAVYSTTQNKAMTNSTSSLRIGRTKAFDQIFHVTIYISLQRYGEPPNLID